MKRVLFILAALLPLIATAETREQRAESPHELRIGVGDPLLFMAFLPVSDPGSGDDELWFTTFGLSAAEAHNKLANATCFAYNGKAHNIGHFFLEYQYRINSYIGVGVDVDMITHCRKIGLYNGYHDLIAKRTGGSFYMDIIPRARFTFLHKQYVNLYASAGIGLSIDHSLYPNGRTWFSPLFDVTLFGISIGENHVFGTFEVFDIGANLIEFDFSHTQLFTASIGYRF